MPHARQDVAPAPAEDESEYDLSGQIGFVLRQAMQRHASIFTELMGSGLTPAQWAVLARLERGGRISQNELGRQAAMDVATVKGVVDRLLRRGLLRSSPDPDDGRRRMLELTGPGRALVREKIATARAVSKLTLRPLAPQQRLTLLALLRQLR